MICRRKKLICFGYVSETAFAILFIDALGKKEWDTFLDLVIYHHDSS